MLSWQPTSRNRPAAAGSNRQGAMDRRASASTVEIGIRSRPQELPWHVFPVTVLWRSWLRLLAALPHCQDGTEKESTGHPPRPAGRASTIVALIARASDPRYPYCRTQGSEKQQRGQICQGRFSEHARRLYDRAGNGRSASSTRWRRAIFPTPRARRAGVGRQ